MAIFKYLGRHFRHRDSEKSGVRQFILLVRTVTDTPALIQRIAEDRYYLRCCAAIVKPEDQKDAFLRHLAQELKKSSYQQQFPYERLQEKLAPVGIALGLKGRTADSIQSDYYHILGISASATNHEIKTAYRKKVKEWHPDTAKGEKEQFIHIQDAYQVLSDEALRHQYDLSRSSFGRWNWSENTEVPASKKKSFLQSHRVEVSFVAFILILAGASFVADSINQYYSLTEDIVSVENRADTSVDRDMSGQEGSTKMQSSMVAKQEKIETFNVPKIEQNKVARIADQSKKHPRSINQKTISRKAEKKELLAIGTETKRELSTAKIAISKSKQPEKKPKQLITEKKDLRIAKTETKREPEQVAVSKAVPAKEVNDKPEKQTVSKIERVSKGLSAQLANFLRIYCQTYEGKDLERITGFFADNARENGQSFQELIPKYRQNFDVVDEINYRIDMANYLWDIDENRVKINGEFFLSWRKNEERGLHQYHGDISMKLIFHDNSFLIEDLSYRFDR